MKTKFYGGMLLLCAILALPFFLDASIVLCLMGVAVFVTSDEEMRKYEVGNEG